MVSLRAVGLCYEGLVVETGMWYVMLVFVVLWSFVDVVYVLLLLLWY